MPTTLQVEKNDQLFIVIYADARKTNLANAQYLELSPLFSANGTFHERVSSGMQLDWNAIENKNSGNRNVFATHQFRMKIQHFTVQYHNHERKRKIRVFVTLYRFYRISPLAGPPCSIIYVVWGGGHVINLKVYVLLRSLCLRKKHCSNQPFDTIHLLLLYWSLLYGIPFLFVECSRTMQPS